MRFFPKLIGNRELATLTISFGPSGNYSVAAVQHLPVTNLKVIETFCQYYLKTLFMSGDSKVSKFIIQKFTSFASEFDSKGFTQINLFDTLNDIGLLLDLGFNLANHLKITSMTFVPLVSEAKVVNHRIVLFQNKSGRTFIQTQPTAWQSKVYIPLALFAFFHYCSQQYLNADNALQAAFSGCVETLHQHDGFRDFHKTSQYALLSDFVSNYFAGFEKGRVMLQ